MKKAFIQTITLTFLFVLGSATMMFAQNDKLAVSQGKVEQRVEKWAEKLNLTADQKSEVLQIMLTAQERRAALSQIKDADQKRAKTLEMRKELEEGLKATLTEEQYIKVLNQTKARRGKREKSRR